MEITCSVDKEADFGPTDGEFILDVYREFAAAILKAYIQTQMSYMISTVSKEGKNYHVVSGVMAAAQIISSNERARKYILTLS